MCLRGVQGTEPRVLAVIVLYRMAPEESVCLSTLLQLRQEFGSAFAVAVWDNSPEPHPVPAGFEGIYHADPANPGLAPAYNFALQTAAEAEVPWLMLLDQDTELTRTYLDEVLTKTMAAEISTVALLPRLLHRGAVISPVRAGAVGPAKPIVEGGSGEVQGFNSGAVVRVSAVAAMGGFDCRFPLDYLDHATFAGLQARGGRVRALCAELQHNLSSDTGRAATALERSRQRMTLQAEARFYRIYGKPRELWLHPLRLLRRAVSVVVHKGDWRSAAQVVQAMFCGGEPQQARLRHLS